jgi:hypothetical protein
LIATVTGAVKIVPALMWYVKKSVPMYPRRTAEISSSKNRNKVLG